MFVSDLVSVVGNRELFSEKTSLVEFAGAEIAQKEFPEVKLVDSEHIVYFPFRLCHSMPQVNSRGRAFMPKVLANSFASASDQLIDIEHMIKKNFPGQTERICGFIKAIKYDDTIGSEIASKLEELTYVPETPIPVKGLGALWVRSDGIKTVVSEHNKNQSWGVSMECSHDWNDAYFRYRNEFIPIKDAPKDMLDCVLPGKVLQYKDHDLVVCLGGLANKVDFYGAAITRSPSDADAKAGKMFSFVSGQSREVASKNIFFMPLREYSVPSSSIDTEIASRIEEMASIDIIGETEAADDGHRHYVLSDMTVLPGNGHEHYSSTLHISAGTKPMLTGRTGTHDVWMRNQNTGQETRHTHMHLIKIPLNKKFKNSGETDDEAVVATPAAESASGTVSGDILPNASSNQEAQMKLTEIASNVANQGSLISKLLSAKTDEERASIAAQIQTVNKQLTDGLSGEIAGETIEAAVQEKLKSGEYVTKADAQKLADDAKAAAAEEAKKVQEQKDKEAARIQAIRDAKLNVEYTVPGIDKKVGEFLSTFEFNANGDQQFAANIKLLTSIPEALVKEATPAGAEAASKNGPGGTVPQGSPGYLDRIKALAGGGPGSSSATQPSNENASQSRRGRHAFSQPVK